MMLALKPEFDAQANLSDIAGDIDGAVAESDGNAGTETEGSNIDSLTMEYYDNPFSSLIRKIESLCEADPVSAYYLLLSVKNDGIYNQERQIQILEAKQDEIIHKIENDVLAQRNEKEGLSCLFGEQAFAAPALETEPETPDLNNDSHTLVPDYRPAAQLTPVM